MMRRNGLKGQQRSAQGSALGTLEAQPSPCKGKRTIAGQHPAITLLPFQGGGVYSSSPRALPWADHCCPFGAFERRILPCYFLSLLNNTVTLYHSYSLHTVSQLECRVLPFSIACLCSVCLHIGLCSLPFGAEGMGRDRSLYLCHTKGTI